MNYGLTEYGEIFIFEGGGGTGGVTYYAGTGLSLTGHTFAIDLVAGDNITISGNTISAVAASYTAGNGVGIDGGTISTVIAADGGLAFNAGGELYCTVTMPTAGEGVTITSGTIAVNLTAGDFIDVSGSTVSITGLATQEVAVTAGTTGEVEVSLCPGTITVISGDVADLQVSYTATAPDTPAGVTDCRECGIIFSTGGTATNASGSFVNWTSGYSDLRFELVETPEADKNYVLSIQNGVLIIKSINDLAAV